MPTYKLIPPLFTPHHQHQGLPPAFLFCCHCKQDPPWFKTHLSQNRIQNNQPPTTNHLRNCLNSTPYHSRKLKCYSLHLLRIHSWKINREPEDRPIEKENHLPSTSILAGFQQFTFQGVNPISSSVFDIKIRRKDVLQLILWQRAEKIVRFLQRPRVDWNRVDWIERLYNSSIDLWVSWKTCDLPHQTILLMEIIM